MGLPLYLLHDFVETSFGFVAYALEGIGLVSGLLLGSLFLSGFVCHGCLGATGYSGRMSFWCNIISNERWSTSAFGQQDVYGIVTSNCLDTRTCRGPYGICHED